MTRNLFGWSYPPGVTQRDIDAATGADARDPTEEEDAILDILDTSNLSPEAKDTIMKLIDDLIVRLSP